jgi:hypothetical protein
MSRPPADHLKGEHMASLLMVHERLKHIEDVKFQP